MIEAILDALGGWIWWLIGLLLLGVEVLVPGYFFLWFGVAALIIGVGAVFVDWPWQAEIVGFAVLSVVAALLGRQLTSYADMSSDDPFLNERAGRLAGRVLTLHEPIVEGMGRVRVDDTVWRVRGPDLSAGARVRIVGADGTTLLVEPA